MNAKHDYINDADGDEKAQNIVNDRAIDNTMQYKTLSKMMIQLMTQPRYDNCYPRIDGTTNIGGTYIDFQASAQHLHRYR